FWSHHFLDSSRQLGQSEFQPWSGGGIGQKSMAAAIQSEAIGKLALLVDRFKVHFSIFAEVEYDRLDLSNASDPLHLGEAEFNVGIGARF
ncbi:hypothetical protein WDW37_21180, partial [Bdellovibrionota bacterium FG-1]